MNKLQLMKQLVMAGAALLLSSAAQSAELVTNGGFETGSFAGWTQFGNTGFTGVTGGSAHNGAFFSFFGPVGSTGGISQSIATTAGQHYAVDFWLSSDGGNPNGFNFNWDGGVAETTLVNAGAFAYTHFSYDLIASSSSTSLSFSFRNDPGYYFFDDVSVTGSSDVPEPGTFALLGLGLAGLGFAARKKQDTPITVR